MEIISKYIDKLYDKLQSQKEEILLSRIEELTGEQIDIERSPVRNLKGLLNVYLKSIKANHGIGMMERKKGNY